MKKLLALLLAIFMVISLCACDNTKSRDRDDDDDTTEATVSGSEVLGDEGDPEGDDTPSTPEPDKGRSFNNFSANMVITANGETIPGVLKMDFENRKALLEIENEKTKGFIAMDDEAVYTYGGDNGGKMYGQVISFNEFFPASVSGSNSQMPEISEEDLNKLIAEFEKLIPMLDGEKDFDLEAIAGILDILGVDMEMDALLAEIGITAEQAEGIVNSVLNLINDPEWLAKNFTVENTVADGTGTFSLKGDPAPAIYDLMAVVATEMGEEVPAFDESGIPSMPVEFTITLADYIPTALKLELAGMFSANATLKITDSSFDLDANVTVMGETMSLAIDGAITGDTATLTVDFTADGQTARILDLTAKMEENKVSIALDIASSFAVTMDCEFADGKITSMKAEVTADGETITVSIDDIEYDNTVVDISDVKKAAEESAEDDDDLSEVAVLTPNVDAL